MNGKRDGTLKRVTQKSEYTLILHGFRLINPITNEIVNLVIGTSIVIDGQSRMLWIDYGFCEKASILKNIENTEKYGAVYRYM
jgi:hypothetical protein